MLASRSDFQPIRTVRLLLDLRREQVIYWSVQAVESAQQSSRATSFDLIIIKKGGREERRLPNPARSQRVLFLFSHRPHNIIIM
jgi:hypothetical protein